MSNTGSNFEMTGLFRILCKCLFSEVTVQAVTELDNKAAHCHTPVILPAPTQVPAVFHQGQPAQSALSAAAATVGGSESLPVILRQDEVSEELMISINALPGLCVIVLWCTVNGQFIPQSQ